MKSALIYNGIVIQMEDSQFPVSEDLSWEDYDEGSVTVKIGYIYEGEIFSDPLTLEESISNKKLEINSQRDRALLADITITVISVGSVELQVSKDTFFTLQSLIDAGSTINWILKDNTTASFVTADFVVFRDALIARNDEIYQARKRKDAVEALITIATVDSYDITTIYA